MQQGCDANLAHACSNAPKKITGMEHKVNVFALNVVVLYPLNLLPEIVGLSRPGSSAVVGNNVLLLKSARQAKVTKTSLVAGAL